MSDQARRGFGVYSALIGLFLATSSAPTPMYSLYADEWGFPPVVLSLVFAVYCVTLLLALLVAGSLSDAIGRRPVTLVSIALQMAGLVLFLGATSEGWLFAARTVQGFATGLATAAVSAAILDLAPRDRPGRGALVNGLLPTVGLAVGAAVSGLFVQFLPAPTRTVYAVLLLAFGVFAALVVILPEPRPGHGNVALRPRVGVPRGMRAVFLAGSLSIVGSWSFGGFHLSLGPSVVQDVTGSDNRLVGGASFGLLCAVAATAVFAFRSWSADRLMAVGGFAMTAGVGLTVTGVLTASLPVLFAGAAVTGVGFGPSFAGAFRAIATAAPADRRGEVVAATYIVSYLALSVPAIVGGALATRWPLATVTVGYGIAVMAIAASAAIAATIRLTSVAPAPSQVPA